MSASGLLGAQSLLLESARALPATSPALELGMRLDLGARATEALEAGLALSFVVEWQLDDDRRLSERVALRYSPLLRSYALAVGTAPPQTFNLRNSMLAAFEHLRLHWESSEACKPGCQGRVRVRLDLAALPAPLRLPALLDSAWSFDSHWQTSTP